jgi:hypothetical protein
MTQRHLDPATVFDRVSSRWPEANDRPFADGRDVFPAQQQAEREARRLDGELTPPIL